MRDAKILSNTSLFGALSEDGVAFLNERAEDVHRASGEVFFTQGDTGDAVYLLLSGRAIAIRSGDNRECELAEFHAGDLFGEMALVAIQKRNATVRAVEDCSTLALKHQTILELYQFDLEQFTLLQMNLSRDMARRLACANEELFAARCQGYVSPPPGSGPRTNETSRGTDL